MLYLPVQSVLSHFSVCRRGISVLPDRRSVTNRGQRVPQLVGESCQELIALLHGFLQFLFKRFPL